VLEPENFFYTIFVAIFGLILGSFSTAVTYREACGLPWFVLSKKKADAWSRCPSCDARLTTRDLIPVLSWCLNGGKCRHCSQPVSGRYPLTEVLSCLMCVGIYAAYGWSVSAMLLMLLVPFLLALIFIDLDQFLLPNRLVAICAVLSFVWVGWRFYAESLPVSFLISHIGAGLFLPAAMYVLGWVMSKILQRSALGMGDVKFMVPVGLLLGFEGLSAFLIGAGAVGVAMGTIYAIFVKQRNFPFGPALIVALFGVLVLKDVLYQ
jgi:leader peptidase (prepilin peptidase)/N-methyltransferase